ncbi:hypothetical protein BDB01DRAFT_811917 [Pilobolus umbonatus]|nr:hypothetical protein BDB01DRAFT_811917 [Pilobolus umbonatus]
MAQTMVRESRMDNKETDEDVDNDRESSLDSFLVEHDYDHHDSSFVSSSLAYNDADMDPLLYHSFSSSNNKRKRQ